MIIDKEIRCVALYLFQPNNLALESLLRLVEKEKPMVMVRYNRQNAVDATCMEIVFGLKVVGYVNSDDKRYVEPLLRKTDYCMAKFYEVYQEENHSPIIRFIIKVDLCDVLPIEPGEEWKGWHYTFPVIPMLDEIKTETYTGKLLQDILIHNKDFKTLTIEELLEAFVSSSSIDMSVETSIMYDELLFYLELKRSKNRSYINYLQHGSTVRRSEKQREKMVTEWWPKFLCSDAAKNLCLSYVENIKNIYGEISDDSKKTEYDRLCSEMYALPYSLSKYLSDIKTIWAKMFYNNVPREKLLQVLSGLTLYTKIRDAEDKKIPFVVEGMNVNISGGNIIFSGNTNITGDIIESGGIKIER